MAVIMLPSEISATSGGVIGVLLLVILTLVMTIAILVIYIKTRGKENDTGIYALGHQLNYTFTYNMYIQEFSPLDT